MAGGNVVTSIGTEVNNLVNYCNSKPLHMMKVPELIGKWGEFYRGDELGSTTFVKRAGKPARAYHIIEFVADVKNLIKAIIEVGTDGEKSAYQKVEDVFYHGCFAIEAYPRSYKAYKYFACSDRELPGGDKAKTVGDIAGFLAGALIFKRSAMALWDLDAHCLKRQTKEVGKLNTFWNRGIKDPADLSKYQIGFAPGRTTEKVKQGFLAVFGACFAGAEALAIAKKFEVINKDNVPKWVSLVISTCTTFSFLAASYQSS